MAQSRKSSSISWWNNAQYRAIFFQILLVLGVALFFLFIIRNTLHNLEQRGIATGFGFLSQRAGFGINLHLVPYTDDSTYGRTFIVGLLNTMLVSGLGIVFATILGVIAGVARLSTNWIVRKIATVYVEIFRNVPLLIQIFFWYFAVLRTLPSPRQSLHLGESIFLNVRGVYLPWPVFEQGFGWVALSFLAAVVFVIFLRIWAKRRQDRTGEQFPVLLTSLAVLFGLPALVFYAGGTPLSWDLPELKGFNFVGGMVVLPELAALLMALTIYTGTFIAEIVRSGILAVSHGQTEAALALGLRPGKVLRLVVFPQAMRVIIPQMTSQYLNLTKNSSLATAIGYPDLVAVFAGTTLNQAGQAIEIIAMTMAVYLTLSLAISMFMNWYNQRTMLRER